MIILDISYQGFLDSLHIFKSKFFYISSIYYIEKEKETERQDHGED